MKQSQVHTVFVAMLPLLGLTFGVAGGIAIDQLAAGMLLGVTVGIVPVAVYVRLRRHAR